MKNQSSGNIPLKAADVAAMRDALEIDNHLRIEIDHAMETFMARMSMLKAVRVHPSNIAMDICGVQPMSDQFQIIPYHTRGGCKHPDGRSYSTCANTTVYCDICKYIVGDSGQDPDADENQV